MGISAIHTPRSPEDLLCNPKALRAILDAADIPINFCSADRKFLFVNETYARWYGSTPERIVGRPLADLLGREGDETIRPFYERALAGEQVHYEAGVMLSIGYRYLRCNYTPIPDEHGVITGWVGIIYDMTQHHTLEEALKKSQADMKVEKEKAEAANAAKSEFLANMSHEIRTPMNAVAGLAQILSRSEPLTDKQKEFVGTLEASAQSLLTLINDLLDLSKLESSGIELERIPYRFAGIVDSILLMFAMQAEEKGIALHYEKSALDETLFLGDPLRIRQILTNLIGNAVKFTDHGNVRIRVSSTLAFSPGQSYLHVSVKDTGIGIPADKAEAIFDKFTQGDNSTARRYGGSGLGLAISRSMAQLMGGSITLSSYEGQGSEFVLHLPLFYARSSAYAPGTLARPQPNQAGHNEHNGQTILLAEDHPPSILVATTLIESMGHRCDVARNGREAVEKLRAGHERYVAVLMDVRMPDMDGYAVTRLLREDEHRHGYRRLPVIGITANTMREDIIKCYEAGMDDHLAKPFNFDDLQQKITALMTE